MTPITMLRPTALTRRLRSHRTFLLSVATLGIPLLLGLRVVAEGIELQEQAHYLAAHGHPFMQGYLFHRPMPLAQVILHLDSA